jgi:hypothetical protein
MSILDNARRRIRGKQAGEAVAAPAVADTPAVRAERPTLGRLELSLSPEGLRRYAPILAARCGLADVPNSPDSLSAAIALAIAQSAGQGRPRVTRSPAGPRTPERWLISIDDADEMARAVLDLASRDGSTRTAQRNGWR